MHIAEQREDRDALLAQSNERFFFPQSAFGRDICSVLMVVTMPSSLVRVNKGRGWQIVATLLSNIHIQVGFCVCVQTEGWCLRSTPVITYVFHSSMHTTYSSALYSSYHVCLVQWLVDNQCICLASLRNPLVFHGISNSAVLEHKKVRYGNYMSSPSYKRMTLFLFINNDWIQQFMN